MGYKRTVTKSKILLQYKILTSSQVISIIHLNNAQHGYTFLYTQTQVGITHLLHAHVICEASLDYTWLVCENPEENDK